MTTSSGSSRSAKPAAASRIRPMQRCGSGSRSSRPARALSVMPYLLKTEPSTYSFADLQKEKNTTWDGVKNPFALRNLAKMESGEKLVIYHTGDEKSAVGTAMVLSVNASDPRDPRVKIT